MGSGLATAKSNFLYIAQFPATRPDGDDAMTQMTQICPRKGAITVVALNKDQIIPLTVAPKHLPQASSGKRVHIATIYRWTLKGLRDVKLETIQADSTRYKLREAIDRFTCRLTKATDATRGCIPPTSISSCHPAPRNRTEIERSVHDILEGRSDRKAGNVTDHPP